MIRGQYPCVVTNQAVTSLDESSCNLQTACRVWVLTWGGRKPRLVWPVGSAFLRGSPPTGPCVPYSAPSAVPFPCAPTVRPRSLSPSAYRQAQMRKSRKTTVQRGPVLGSHGSGRVGAGLGRQGWVVRVGNAGLGWQVWVRHNNNNCPPCPPPLCVPPHAGCTAAAVELASMCVGGCGPCVLDRWCGIARRLWRILCSCACLLMGGRGRCRC